jgi:RHS repeat-associated protein
MREDSDSGTEVYYILTDHLGSTSKVVQVDGSSVSVTAQQWYKPWGGVRQVTGEMPTDRTYTGQREHSSLSMLWYNSRFYDPYLGRFTQPDSIIPLSTQGVQAWDRFAYANNNAVRYNDPSGHNICDEFGNCWENGKKIKVNDGILPNTRYSSHDFENPLSSMVVRGGYDWGEDNGTPGGHRAVDLDVPPEVIVASSYGVVRVSDACSLENCNGLVNETGPETNYGYGNVLIVEYQYDLLPLDFRSRVVEGQSIYVLYAHLDEPSHLNVNTWVEPGDLIGIGGNSGNSTGDHLHLETRVDEPGKLVSGPLDIWQWRRCPIRNPHDFYEINVIE